MRWVYGRILEGVGKTSLAIPDLRWKMEPRLVYGMIYGEGIWLLRTPFQIYLP